MDIYSTYCVIAVGGFFSGIYITLSIAKELGFWYLGTAWHFPYLTVGIAVVIRLGSHFLAGRMRFAITRDMEHEVREMALKKIFSLPGYELKEFAPSELIQLIGEGVDQMVLYNSMYIPQLVYSIVAALTLFFVIKEISITISLVLLISVPLIPMSIMFVAKFAKKTLKKYWMSYSVLGRGFLENLLGLTTLKLYGADSERQRIMNNQAEDFRIATMEVLSMQLNSITLMDLIAFGGAALGMILAIIFASRGSISPAGALTVILLSAEFFIPMRLLGSFFHISMNGLAAGHKLMNLLYKKVTRDWILWIVRCLCL
ncbi:MAG: hypothetical protein GXZ11_00655 [Tissierellia bacterium]|nr:hypothetical protein [Tissierellia bacterium]